MDALRFTLPKILEPNELTPLHGVDGELVSSKVFLSKITPQLTRIRQVVIQPLFLLSLIAYATSASFHASLGSTAFHPVLLLTILVVSKVALPFFEERCSAYLNHNQPNYIAYLENRVEYYLSHNAPDYALIFAQKIPANDSAYKKYNDTLTPAYTAWCQAQLVGRSLEESWGFAHAIPLKSVQEQLVNSLTRQYEDACNVQITSYLKKTSPQRRWTLQHMLFSL